MNTQSTINRTYTIMEAAKLSGLPESTLRYYETIGIIEPIKRDASSKHRVYSESDLNIIDAIACLNATGMSLEDMRAYLRNRNQGAQAAEEQVDLLEAQKHRLIDEARFLKVRQQYVDLKIVYWQAVRAGNDAEAQEIGGKARELASLLRHPEK